mgnify:CR=1 FL=1
MRVFVTGSTGYIGSHLIQGLLAEGYKINAYCRSAEKGNLISKPGVSLFYGDLDDPDAITTAMQDCQFVFHVAALAKVLKIDLGSPGQIKRMFVTSFSFAWLNSSKSAARLMPHMFM